MQVWNALLFSLQWNPYCSGPRFVLTLLNVFNLENQTKLFLWLDEKVFTIVDFSYQCWFALEEARIYCNNFSSSNAVVCSRLVLAYTVRLAIINAVELERNGCFSLSLLRNVVLCLRRTSINRIANRISCQIWYKGCLKGTFGRGVQICEGVSKSVLTEAFLVLCFGSLCDWLTERNKM